ncbi:MAG: hypothetical protein JWQ11_3427 [Rhizobacter sp.]|nr:hypothetical protein [Rhizobacter sp.]
MLQPVQTHAVPVQKKPSTAKPESSRRKQPLLRPRLTVEELAHWPEIVARDLAAMKRFIERGEAWGSAPMAGPALETLPRSELKELLAKAGILTKSGKLPRKHR